MNFKENTIENNKGFDTREQSLRGTKRKYFIILSAKKLSYTNIKSCFAEYESNPGQQKLQKILKAYHTEKSIKTFFTLFQ